MVTERPMCLHKATNISHESWGRVRAITPPAPPPLPLPSPPKVLTNSLYARGDTSPDKKVFRASRRICIYLWRAHRVPGLFIFPRWLHRAHRGTVRGWGSCRRLRYFADRRTNGTIVVVVGNRYVFRVARLVRGIASWPRFRERTFRRTLIITRNFAGADLTCNFTMARMWECPRKNVRTCILGIIYSLRTRKSGQRSTSK